MRESILAGTWYPATARELDNDVSQLLNQASPEQPQGRIFAIISPHAGYRYSGKAAAYGYKLFKNVKSIKKVFILAPSHQWSFRGVSIRDVEAYQTPLGVVPVDQDISAKLREHPLFDDIPQADSREHSLEIQLPFLQKVLTDFKIIPMVVGQLETGDFEAIAAAIKPFIDENSVVVISSDFTHYGHNFGYVPFRDNVKENLAKLDGGAINLITARDFTGFRNYLDKTDITICGREPISILLKLLPENSKAKQLLYYTSGDVTGDFVSSVSYTSIIFTVPANEEKAAAPPKL